MKLLTYAINKKELTGVLNREGTFVYPLSAAGMEYRTMKEVIREIGPSELELLDHISGLPPYEVSNAAPLEDIKIMAPIPVPDQDIICLGINYLAHAEESARFKRKHFPSRIRRCIFPSGSTGPRIPAMGSHPTKSLRASWTMRQSWR